MEWVFLEVATREWLVIGVDNAVLLDVTLVASLLGPYWVAHLFLCKPSEAKISNFLSAFLKV